MRREDDDDVLLTLEDDEDDDDETANENWFCEGQLKGTLRQTRSRSRFAKPRSRCRGNIAQSIAADAAGTVQNLSFVSPARQLCNVRLRPSPRLRASAA